MLLARSGCPGRALLSSIGYLLLSVWSHIINLARAFSPTSRFNEGRVAFEGSWADSSESTASGIVFERSCPWHWFFIMLGGSVR